MSQPGTAPGGGRWVEVPPERIARWVGTFATRHGQTAVELAPEGVILRAADGAAAQCHVPFPPLRLPAAGEADPAGPAVAAQLMAAHAATDRTVGVLLVRLGGFAAGVFTGDPPRLISSKTGARLVHGRSAAGGWSQQRFARRREKQAATALAAACDAAAAVLGPYTARLDAVVLGGDKRAIAAVRADTRLAAVLDRAVARFLTVPDPRRSVLERTPEQFRAIRIKLTGPP